MDALKAAALTWRPKMRQAADCILCLQLYIPFGNALSYTRLRFAKQGIRLPSWKSGAGLEPD